MAKFKVTYKINGVTVSNVIEPNTQDLYFLYLVQKSVADEWSKKNGANSELTSIAGVKSWRLKLDF